LFGKFFPRWKASTATGWRGRGGLLTLALAVWTWRGESRRWVRRLAGVALLTVVAQAILGGITVLFLLPTAVSTTHAGLANLFFSLTVAIAVVTGPWWAAHEAGPRPAEARDSGRRRGLAASGNRRGHV
jgi:heme A synthase